MEIKRSDRSKTWISGSFLVVGSLLLLFSTACTSGGKGENPANEPAEIVEEAVPIPLAELEAGEVFYKNREPFGKVIELAGRQVVADTVIFKVGGTEMLVKNGQLGIKNRVNNHTLMRFSLPGMNFMNFSGLLGGGPGELKSPTLVPTPERDIFCYVFEAAGQKLYQWDMQGKLTPVDYPFTSSRQPSYSDKQLAHIGSGDFIYAESSPTGKSIFRSTLEGDSVSVREIFQLRLNPKRKSWVNYIGDFAVNPKRDRMAYAYKYFKIIKFMDLEAMTVRTINFEREEFDENTLYVADGMDQNVTHYWGCCPGDEYVWFLYSGRTPFDVSREMRQNIHYIYVEQYDWNGNPVAKYKLDHWGYFTVDEKEKQIWLASTGDDDPLFVFDIK